MELCQDAQFKISNKRGMGDTHPTTQPFKPFELTSFPEQISLSSEDALFSFKLRTHMAGNADTELSQHSLQIPPLTAGKDMLQQG